MHDYYDWHAGWQAEISHIGSIPDAVLLKLEKNNEARKFNLECKWKHQLDANFIIGDSKIDWNWRIVL